MPDKLNLARLRLVVTLRIENNFRLGTVMTETLRSYKNVYSTYSFPELAVS